MVSTSNAGSSPARPKGPVATPPMFIAPTTLPEGANIRRTLSDSSGTSDTLRSETGSVAHGPQRERDLEKGIKPSDDAKVPTKVKGTTKKALPGQIGEQASVPIAGTAKPKRDATKKTRQADDAKVAKKAKSPSKTAGQEHNEKRKPAVRAPGVAAAGPMSPKRESGGPPGKPGAPAQEDDPFLVTIKGREHLHPHSWGSKYRWFLTCFGGLMVLNATFASTGPSQLIPSIDAHFGVSEEVGLLTISLFVLGYCVGPAFWGPLSERYGRKNVFLVSWLPYVAWQAGCALSPNIGALLAFRFLSGCFAAAPVSNVGGFLADLWDADKRGIALGVFALSPFSGPAIAPIIAGVLQDKGINWRWMFWIMTMFAGIYMVLLPFILPETYLPYILHKEAKKLRKETGDNRYHAALDEMNKNMTFKKRLEQSVLKPFIMQAEEPMLLILNLYMAFIYGLLYVLFEAYPIIYQEIHGWNSLEGGLPFLGLVLGGALAVVVYIIYWNRTYMKKLKQLAPKKVPPEERLRPILWAAPLFAVSIFWFGLTGAYKSINPASPILAGILLGSAILLLFLGILNYIIDTYLMNAASAIAANTILRSLFGAGFPLFSVQMYDRLGVQGASALLGGIAVVFIPAPFILMRYGKRIRSWSKNAKVLD